MELRIAYVKQVRPSREAALALREQHCISLAQANRELTKPYQEQLQYRSSGGQWLAVPYAEVEGLL